MAQDRWDFAIIVASPARPTVLVIEAGGDNADIDGRVDGFKYVQQANPDKNWQDTTVPQKHLNGRTLSLARGRGLGGGSAINFSSWVIGPRDDYDHIAKLVQDDGWKWDKVKTRYKQLEKYHPTGIYKHRLKARCEDHGYEGDLQVGFPETVEAELYDLVDAAVDAGIPICADQNSGEPIGIAISASTARKGRRVMASDLLEPKPENLTIWTKTTVSQIIFDGSRANGVLLSDGREIFVRKEVILCAGPLADPKILMHSGIGPKETMQRFQIPVVQLNENVGQHLNDHQLAVFSWARSDTSSERLAWFRDSQRRAAARKQWEEEDGTGPLAHVGTSIALAYPKLDRIIESDEFAALDKETQALLKLETVPHWEFALGVPSLEYHFDPANASTMLSIFTFLLNEQSKGSVTIRSADPNDAVVVDCNFFSHPFDRRMAIEVTRDLLGLVRSPGFAKDTVGDIAVPRSESDEDVLDFWRSHSFSGSHMMGTCTMGIAEKSAVVDKDFRVFGVEKLRVCSTSVLPLLPNCHLQSTSYLVGLMLSDKLISHHSLGQA
ncbi:Oxygen-dependent choline dehydrogenase 1 [Cyphellophora attinorum]|uniref:Oxygen-dependent choline dehydrogenase 1 n=1 Tax=Cyphellophora attinorum TaxID=1664694 RepID=A0A0N1HEX1_9EURO|nr:Oxygen-dependent choline dehydrogenase 1 [Phialophora attinorum]KPI43533.1 Oxygen-dependent choline dehydrogenase 1 [Phialophora attinorum]